MTNLEHITKTLTETKTTLDAAIAAIEKRDTASFDEQITILRCQTTIASDLLFLAICHGEIKVA
jgi:hypothetical protein